MCITKGNLIISGPRHDDEPIMKKKGGIFGYSSGILFELRSHHYEATLLIDKLRTTMTTMFVDVWPNEQ